MYNNVVLVTQPMGNEHPAWTGETATPSLVYPACPVTTLQKALYASTTVGTVHGDRVWGPEWRLPGCAQSSPGFMPPFSFFFLCNATISLSLLNSPTEGTMLSHALLCWLVGLWCSQQERVSCKDSGREGLISLNILSGFGGTGTRASSLLCSRPTLLCQKTHKGSHSVQSSHLAIPPECFWQIVFHHQGK